MAKCLVSIGRKGAGLVSGGEDKRVQINGGENLEDTRMLGV